ncbi:MAG: energy transducer TonB [Gammaproteobacteria bacterium]|nr:energy transducer TonB [Gammaproteobacteria bacterium]MDH4255261.1 energy transducer TonB [Gammaproteobacteria bacterium]MDH5309993.1 energy transducer TonB [Gammaproteobacteria bacterium]
MQKFPDFGRLLACSLLYSALLVPAWAGADQTEAKDAESQEESRTDSTLIRFFIDSSTDRTPATTAFPQYPRIARRDRIEGDATVCFRIDTEGKIHSVKVQNYSHRIFRRPALQAIKASSFEPLGPNELLQRARSCRTYRFRLMPVTVAGDQ